MAARLLIAALLLAGTTVQAPAASLLDDPWPIPVINESSGQDVTIASHTPFVLEDVNAGPGLNPPRDVSARFYLPDGASPSHKAPAVVLLHGSAGILQSRELTYGPQYAAMGIAALVVDTFGSRRDIATAYVDRVLRITETAMVSDAYAALRWLAARPDVDARKVALIGFSYGALAALLAAYEQPAARFAPDGLRFAAHVTYYGPCLAKFEDSRGTGAPILMLSAEYDAVTDPKRCAEAAADLRRGGAPVEQIRYDGAYHQWDGDVGGPTSPVRRASNLAACRFNVARDGTVSDAKSGIEMSNAFFRKIILGLCNDSEGYLQARNESVRLKSNRDVGRFLAAAFEGGAPNLARRP